MIYNISYIIIYHILYNISYIIYLTISLEQPTPAEPTVVQLGGLYGHATWSTQWNLFGYNLGIFLRQDSPFPDDRQSAELQEASLLKTLSKIAQYILCFLFFIYKMIDTLKQKFSLSIAVFILYYLIRICDCCKEIYVRIKNFFCNRQTPSTQSPV